MMTFIYNGKSFDNMKEMLERTVWMDSACEDAYDLLTATAIAYPMCKEWEEEHPSLFVK